MKRKWAYLGALLPASTAVSLWATEVGAHSNEETGKIHRSKNAPETDEAKAQAGQGGSAKDDGSGPRAQTLAPGTSEETRAPEFDEEGPELAAAASHDRIDVPLPDSDASMFLPSASNAKYADDFSAGGLSTVKVVNSGGNPPVVPGADEQPNEGGDVISDPVDSDSMLILLGGMATGEGEGAASTGEVVFDIVDYGAFTIGYGYATYTAQGSESAEADTFYSVYGADLVFTYRDDDESGNSDSSSTYVLAIDFEEGLSAEQHPGLSSLNWMELLGQGPFAQAQGGEEEEPISINGNLADVSFEARIDDDEAPDAVQFSSLAFDNLGSSALVWLQSEQAAIYMNGEAQGIDTFVLSEGTLLEIEDQFSSVNGAMTIIA
jgi:hypothetical protein